VDDELSSRYIEYLITTGMYARARETWAAYLGNRKGAYTNSNELFNGGFEQEPTGALLDWQFGDIAGLRVERTPEARSGQYALKMTFEGTHNVDYSDAFQVACVPPGRYMVRAWVRSDGITTDQGPYLRIRDGDPPQQVDIQTQQWRETHDWTPIEASFSIAAAATPIVVEVRRDSSLKFDNKISGTFWLDDVSIETAR
jgi:hypothetical protein